MSLKNIISDAYKKMQWRDSVPTYDVTITKEEKIMLLLLIEYSTAKSIHCFDGYISKEEREHLKDIKDKLLAAMPNLYMPEDTKEKHDELHNT